MQEVITQTGKITRQGSQYLIILQSINIPKVKPFLNQKVTQEIRFKHGTKTVVIEQKGLIVQKTSTDSPLQLQIFIQKKNVERLASFLDAEGIDEEIILSSIVPTVSA